MKNKVYDPGDIKIIGMKMTNYNKSATRDIRGQVISLSIFEDIEQPSVYAEILLKDGVNLVKDFPILGEEFLEISYITPGRDSMTIYKLKTFSVSSTGVDPSNKASTYILKAVSPEHFTSSINLTERSYKETVDKIVNNILDQDVETGKGRVIEETRGIVPITIPRMSPFQAIDFLRQKAIAKRPSGGVFVFYENQYGYNFTSIEKLIEDGKESIGSKIFTHAPEAGTDSIRQTYVFRNIIQLEQLSKFDTIDKLTSGYFKNNVKSFDLLTKSFDETKFDITEQASKFIYSDRNSSIPNSTTLVDQALSGAPTYMFAPKDSSRGEDFVADLLGYRRAFVKLFNQAVTRCMVHGDNYLSVGDMVELKLPDTSGTTGKKNDDNRYSGNYLITKLRHIIVYEENKFKHRVVFDCNRVGVGV